MEINNLILHKDTHFPGMPPTKQRRNAHDAPTKCLQRDNEMPAARRHAALHPPRNAPLAPAQQPRHHPILF
jgi:hypothetical protein